MVRTLVVVIGLLLESGEVMCVPVLGPLCSGARVSPIWLMAPPGHALPAQGRALVFACIPTSCSSLGAPVKPPVARTVAGLF